MHKDTETPEPTTLPLTQEQATALKPAQLSVRCSFKRVLSAERPDLETTASTCNASRTLPEPSIIEGSFLLGEEAARRMQVSDGVESEEGEERGASREDERFSVRFKKVEMSPSAIREKDKLAGRGEWDNLLVLCVIVYEGKAAEVGCQVTAGELQFSNGCALRLSKITKMKVAYEEYQKCLWLTYEDNSKNHAQEAKLRLHIPNDIKDDLYILFARILLQKLALMNRPFDCQQCE